MILNRQKSVDIAEFQIKCSIYTLFFKKSWAVKIYASFRDIIKIFFAITFLKYNSYDFFIE